ARPDPHGLPRDRSRLSGGSEHVHDLDRLPCLDRLGKPAVHGLAEQDAAGPDDRVDRDDPETGALQRGGHRVCRLGGVTAEPHHRDGVEIPEYAFGRVRHQSPLPRACRRPSMTNTVTEGHQSLPTTSDSPAGTNATGWSAAGAAPR